MSLKLREFNFSDEAYQSIINIHQTVWPDSRHTIESLKHVDANTPVEKYDWLRIVAEWEGKPVGFGTHFRAVDNDVVNQCHISFATHPDFRRRGIASAYLEKLQRELLVDRDVSSLITETQSDKPEAVDFLEKRGFELQLRRVRSELSLDGFDFTRFAPLEARMKRMGVQIQPLSELMETDPDYQRKLWHLEWITQIDQPQAERPKRKTLDEFVNRYINTPVFLPEGWFVATDGDRYIGWSAVLHHLNRSDTMNTGITVVERAYRRNGIATAMKLRTFAFAQLLGKTRIETTNAEINPMLQINLQLGFQPIYAWLEYKRSWLIAGE